MDLIPVPKETWVALASSLMVCSSAVMYAGVQLPLATTLAGAAFGADATLLPLMCGRASSEHQATLYALAKVASRLPKSTTAGQKFSLP